jgi:hypothetical protein
MPSNTTNLALYKKNPATDGLDTFNIDTMLNENWDKIDANVPMRTTANITLYVRTDGNDANSGTADTAGGALKTIQAAINKLPQIINHAVTINVAAGTYNETVTVSGFYGGPSIFINGAAGVADTHVVRRFFFKNNHIPIVLIGFKLTETTDVNVQITSCEYVNVISCRCIDLASWTAIAVLASNAKIDSCNLSNKSVAISSELLSRVLSLNNTGSGNTVGLSTIGAAYIGKEGTQAGATTPETVGPGCQII